MAWLMLMLAVAVLADVIAPYAYTALDLRNRLSPPILFGGTWIHPLGTDELGRDVLSRLIYSIRTSLLIAFGATIIGAAVGTSLGFLAAHFRGLVEQAVLALVDFSASLPFLILALAVLAFFGNSLGLLVCLLGLHAWERYARIARGLALAAGAQGYAAAVRGLGASPWRIYGRHVLPNSLSPLIVKMSMDIGQAILAVASLGFLGLGARPPTPEWGAMISIARGYLPEWWWYAIFPGAFIYAAVLGFNLLGDGLRDILDPKSNRG
jgi:peptide/nickel transport system permease protein